MIQIPATKDLPARVMYFAGKNVSEAIASAEQWARAHGVVLTGYYLQVSDNRSIIERIEDAKNT